MENTEVAEKSAEQVLSEAAESAHNRIAASPDPDASAKQPEPETSPENPTPGPADKGGSDNSSGDEWWKTLDPKTVEDLKAGRVIPNHRLSETAQERDSLKQEIDKLKNGGSSEALIQERDSLVQKVKDLEAKLSAPNAESMSEDDKQSRDWLQKLLPELKDVSTVKELNEAVKQIKEVLGGYTKEREDAANASYATFVDSSIKTFDSEAQRMGVADAKRLGHIFNAIAKSDPALKAKFDSQDQSVWKEVAEIFEKDFASGFRRDTAADLLKNKQQQEKLPKPPAKGGAPASDQPQSLIKKDGDFDWEGAAERGFSRVSK